MTACGQCEDELSNEDGIVDCHECEESSCGSDGCGFWCGDCTQWTCADCAGTGDNDEGQQVCTCCQED